MEKISQRRRRPPSASLRPNSDTGNSHGSGGSNYYVLKAAHTRGRLRGGEREGRPQQEGGGRERKRRKGQRRKKREAAAAAVEETLWCSGWMCRGRAVRAARFYGGEGDGRAKQEYASPSLVGPPLAVPVPLRPSPLLAGGCRCDADTSSDNQGRHRPHQRARPI